MGGTHMCEQGGGGDLHRQMYEAFDGWGRVGSVSLGPSCTLIVEGDEGMAELARGVDRVDGGWWVGEGWVREGRGEGLDCVALR